MIPTNPFLPRASGRLQHALGIDLRIGLRTSKLRILVVHFLLGLLLIGITKPSFKGDAAEYTALTIAVAEHGSPDIRPSDMALAKRLVPEFAWFHESIEKHWTEGAHLPPGFLEGQDKKVHAIHHFGYSAIAAIPFKLLQMVGLNPMKCFLWVDWFCLLILLLAAHTYFGSTKRAVGAALIFLMGVGIPYWNWASPEFFSAALSLAALMLMANSAYIVAGLLVGMASMQNPPILGLLGMGPMIVMAERLATQGRAAVSLAAIRAQARPVALAFLLGCALALVPVYFSMQHFGTWNVIATGATDPRMVSLSRFVSYYLDLNQGVIVAIPGVWLIAAWLLVRDRRLLPVLVPTLLCAVMLAVPALSTQNWNAGSAGMMRYITWGSAPVLYLLFACLRQRAKWGAGVAIVFFLVQFACLAHSRQYVHTEFSPVARWFLVHAPQYYNPEPEIFVDRSTHAEPILDFDTVYRAQLGAIPKTLYYAGSEKGIATLCPDGGRPGAASIVQASYDGWTYLNGELECDSTRPYVERFDMVRFQQQDAALLRDGWSRFEIGAPTESGVWSVGDTSRLTIRAAIAKVDAEAITIRGVYRIGNTGTRVSINGKDLGTWHLDRPNRIPLQGVDIGDALHIQLQHQAPAAPSAQDSRKLAFFMKEVSVAYRTVKAPDAS